MSTDTDSFVCRPGDHPPARTRRGLVQVGALGLFGAGLAEFLELRAAAEVARPERSEKTPRARSVVFIFQNGGPSQFETWDPKPDAPREIRGEYNPIATTVDGLQICEHLPKLARRATRYSILRTLHHPSGPEWRNEHNSAQYLLQSGSLTLPPGDTAASIQLPRARPLEWPSIAAVIAAAADRTHPGAGSFGLPNAIMIPRSGGDGPGRRPGMLGARYQPWSLDLAPLCHAPDPAGSCPNCFSHDDPNDPARAAGPGPKAWWDNSSCRNPRFRTPDLGTPAGLTLSRLSNRRELLARIDGARRDLDADPVIRDGHIHHQRALDLVLGQGRAENPFDLDRESEATRTLYGREEWGQAFLLARRLVEAGVRMVQVNLRGWDTHQNAFRDLKGKLLPSLDHCLSGFLDDLHDRGLLDETLIVMCGEMGRTPVISPITPNGRNASGEIFTPGRHHWGDVFPCFLAGGGVRGGQVVGRTDATGGHPDGDAYTPADLAATIFHQLGVPADMEIRDGAGRPYPVFQGEPIRPLIA